MGLCMLMLARMVAMGFAWPSPSAIDKLRWQGACVSRVAEMGANRRLKRTVLQPQRKPPLLRVQARAWAVVRLG